MFGRIVSTVAPITHELLYAGDLRPRDPLARAQATMLLESVITSPSSRTSTGTKLSPVSRLTSFRPLVTSGSPAKP